MYFRIYGGNKLWTKKEVEEYFNIIDNKYAQCIKNLKGNFDDGEYYNFKAGDVAQIFKTDDNIYLIRG